MLAVLGEPFRFGIPMLLDFADVLGVLLVGPFGGQLDVVYPLRYSVAVVEVRKTETFARWFDQLRDREARSRILVRIRRLSLGNPGDVGPVGEGVSEMRINWGPGYRVYYVHRGGTIVVLLVGGDKRTQDRDIRAAKELARNL